VCKGGGEGGKECRARDKPGDASLFQWQKPRKMNPAWWCYYSAGFTLSIRAGGGGGGGVRLLLLDFGSAQLTSESPLLPSYNSY
jgi:hypothetical protein